MIAAVELADDLLFKVDKKPSLFLVTFRFSITTGHTQVKEDGWKTIWSGGRDISGLVEYRVIQIAHRDSRMGPPLVNQREVDPQDSRYKDDKNVKITKRVESLISEGVTV